MSKSKRNYREPQEIFDRHGADALRWYFFANQAPWTSVRYSEQAIKDSVPEFLLRLWNVYSFFVIYAKIDGFDPIEKLAGDVGQLSAADLARGTGVRPIKQRNELDRWLISELHQTVRFVVDRMDSYDNFAACQKINEFVDGLSNWYVRRSRDRFWSSNPQDQDKLDAYWTLYECLLTTAKMIAPFVPFVAESMWQNLGGAFGDRTKESVHLCDFPVADESVIDLRLSGQMRVLREIASLGRSARMDAKLKVRQPLTKVEVILASNEHQAWLSEHGELLREELNVKQIEYTCDADQYINYQIQPNFKRLGPRVGKLIPQVKQTLASADGSSLLRQLNDTGKVTLTIGTEVIELDGEDIQVRLQAKAGWAAAQGKTCVVVLSTELSLQLIREGLARDLTRVIQERRKDMNLEYTDRIAVSVGVDDDDLRLAIEENREYIMQETLADSLTVAKLSADSSIHRQVGDLVVSLVVEKVHA